MPEQQTPKTRARISHGLRRYHERRRAVLRTVPADLAQLRIRDVAPALAPIVVEAQLEAQSIHEALGGEDAVTPQKRAILADFVRVGVVLRGELSRYLRTQDPDAGSRIGTLATTRRASLQALGLERLARDVDLRSYLAQRQPAQEARHGEIVDVPEAHEGQPAKTGRDASESEEGEA